MKDKKGFTLIELLVVVAIIGVLASVVLVSLNSVRSKGRDATRKSDLKQLSNALELCYNDACNGTYPGPGPGRIYNLINQLHCGVSNGLNYMTYDILAPYISKIPQDPQECSNGGYIAWRKDVNTVLSSPGCTAVADRNKYGLYAKLENPPSASDPNNINNGDEFDLCVKNNFQMNYKIGN